MPLRGRPFSIRRPPYARPVTTTAQTASAQEDLTEPCWRCGAQMEWRHGTFQCPRCRFKIGCCEGVTGECRESAPSDSR